MKICAIIPAYNHANALNAVIDSVLRFVPSLIVVNDGSDDGTAELLAAYGKRIELISYQRNRGKGYALRLGFRRAVVEGFDHAITLDADGQHLAEDIPLLIAAATHHPDALIIGSRGMTHENMPRGNTFANRFSNFWFALQTARRLPDTQTGYRLYPLQRMGLMRSWTSRYEAELELLVRCAWRSIPIIAVPVQVRYPKDRVTHFRPSVDFLRISALNTALVVLAVIYGYPRMALHKLFTLCR